jgi:hypothetical protein
VTPLSPEVERLLREGDERRSRLQKTMREEHFADTERIPELDLMPDCSVCTGPLQYEEGFWCAGCGIRWDRNGTQGYIDPEALDNWY